MEVAEQVRHRVTHSMLAGYGPLRCSEVVCHNTTGCDRGSDQVAYAIAWLCLLSCRRGSIGNILGRRRNGVVVRGIFPKKPN